jgi:hypothetical protein
MTPDITALRLRMRANGFSPLPLMGKVPAMEKWTEKHNCTDAEIRLWPGLWHFAFNTGVLAKFTPGLDIDIMDEAAAKAVEDLAREFFEELGNIYVRFGLPPKRLIPLRCDEPFAKLQRRFATPSGDECKLEALADGQQWAAHGQHPITHKPYRWHGGEIKSIKRDDLPYVRRENVLRFLDAATKLLIEEFGFTLLDDKKQQATNGGDPHETGQNPQASIERIAAALAVIPNNEDWDGWNAIAMATWRATGGSAEGFAAFDAWSRKSPKYDAEQTAKKWSVLFTSPPTHIGAGTIFYLADQASPGWRRARAEEPPPAEPPPDEEPPPEPEEEPPPDPQPQPKPRQHRFPLKPLDNITVSMAPNFLIKGLLPRTGLGVVWGPPKCGKSFWTFDLVMHVACGRNYRGRLVRKGTVIYLALEGSFGFAGRVEAWKQRHKPSKDAPFYLLDVSIDLIADHKALITAIREQVTETPATIVIDTLNRALLGDENKSDDMAKFIRASDAIRTAFGCLMLLIHHCGVAGTRPRGHTSLAGADDVQIAIDKDKDDVVRATVEHMKDGPAGAVIASKLESVNLGTDVDGDPITSCIIVPSEAGAAESKLPKGAALALEVLRKLLASSIDSIPAPKEAQLPADTRVVRQSRWRDHFYNATPQDNQAAKQKAFRRAHDDLLKDKLIDFWDEYVWLPPDKS